MYICKYKSALLDISQRYKLINTTNDIEFISFIKIEKSIINIIITIIIILLSFESFYISVKWFFHQSFEWQQTASSPPNSSQYFNRS